jgi:hypothetical protein
MNAEPSNSRSVGTRPRRMGIAAAAWLCLQALLLTACGPGVGGTGTGLTSAADGLRAFGAQAVAACAPGSAVSLACPAASGLDSTGGNPTAEVWLDTAPGARWRLDVQGDSVTLERRCTQERFKGQWGSSPALGSRYFGVFGAESVPGVPASLGVRTGEGGSLVLELRGLDERLLLPSVTVQRQSGTLPAPTCP